MRLVSLKLKLQNLKHMKILMFYILQTTTFLMELLSQIRSAKEFTY